MSRKHPIDEQFRKQLNQHEIQPDPKIWNNISGVVQKKTRNYGMLWSALIVIAVGLGAWLYLSGTENTYEESSTNQQLSVQDQNVQSSLENADQSAMNASAEMDLNAKAASEQSFPEAVNTQSTESTDLYFENKRLEKENSTIIGSKNLQQKNASAQIGNTTNISARSSKTKTPLGQEKPIDKNIKASSFSNDGTSSNLKRATSLKTMPLRFMEDRSAGNPISDLRSTRNASPELNLAAFSFLEEGNEGFKAFQINKFKKTEENQKALLDQLDICALINPHTNECPTFGALRKRFQIDVYATTGLLLQSLGTNSPVATEWTNHLQEREQSETGSWSVGMGIRLGTQFSNGISMRGGIQISEGRIRLDYDDETQRREVINVSVDTIVDNQGNTVVIWDTLSRQVTGIIPRTEYNTFTQIDIPLTVGYTFLGRDYDVELYGGVMLNALFTRSGRIFGPGEAEFVSIDSDDPNAFNAYRSKLGLSFIISAALNYHLTDQFSAFIEPQLRYYNEAVSPDSYFLKEQWFNINLQVGGRYSF